MFTASQLVAHLWGDYITQSDWMAQNKTKEYLPAAIHAITYSLAFLFFRPSLLAFAVILGTHFLIDRYRLARYLVWFKNWIGSPRFLWGLYKGKWELYYGGNPDKITRGGAPPFEACNATGYPYETPVWLSVWLLIIADNILHITINGLALRFL